MYTRLYCRNYCGKTLIIRMAGYGKAGIEKEKLEYDEKVKRQNAADWTANGTSGFNQLAQNYPSQPSG